MLGELMLLMSVVEIGLVWMGPGCGWGVTSVAANMGAAAGEFVMEANPSTCSSSVQLGFGPGTTRLLEFAICGIVSPVPSDEDDRGVTTCLCVGREEPTTLDAALSARSMVDVWCADQSVS